MRNYTEIFGVLRLQTAQHQFEIEIVCKHKCVVYPVTKNMTEKQIITMLSNHAPLKLKTHKDLIERLSTTLNNLRTVLFNAIRDGIVVDRDLVEIVLPDDFKVRTIGEPHVKEDRAIMIPRNATVSIALEVFPIKWRGTELDLCSVYDFSEAS